MSTPAPSPQSSLGSSSVSISVSSASQSQTSLYPSVITNPMSPTPHQYEWQDDRGLWRPFSFIENAIIVSHENSQSDFIMRADNGTNYSISLSKKTQTNTRTKGTRRIRALAILPPTPLASGSFDYYECEVNGSWQRYSDEICKIITAYQRNFIFEFYVNLNNLDYKISLKTNTQTNVKTGTQRIIRQTSKPLATTLPTTSLPAISIPTPTPPMTALPPTTAKKPYVTPLLGEALYQWLNTDGSWMSFRVVQSRQISEAIRQGLSAVTMMSEDKTVALQVVLGDEIKVVSPTGEPLPVRKADAGTEAGPELWEILKLSGTSSIPKLFPVKYDELGVNSIARAFWQGCPNYDIEKVEVNYNKRHWKVFSALRESWRDSSLQGEMEFSEGFFWHGTNEKSVKNILAQGFKRDFNTLSVYGKGCYFATQPGYALLYSKRKENTNSSLQLLYCHVLVGDYVQGKEGMQTPPQKPGKGINYENMVDNLENPTIFVACTDHQAYPAVVLTVKEKKPVNSQAFFAPPPPPKKKQLPQSWVAPTRIIPKPPGS